MALQFSEDGKYLAHISTEGKLKLWNTLSNSLEQEYTPDFHLTTPCTCLQFWYPQEAENKSSPTPSKRKKRSDPSCNIVLGTTSGIVLVYSVVKADISYTIDSSTNSRINCLSTANNNVLFSGADQNILEWNLEKKQLKSHWKAGNETITSILALPDAQHVVVASKNIKLWNIKRKEVIHTFTGHSSDVVLMHYVQLPGASTYLISGSKSDRLLSCWNLSSKRQQKNAVCNYFMEDVVQNVSVHVSIEGLTSLAVTSRSGVVHLYQHKLNGKSEKPIKPNSTIQIVSDTGQSNTSVVPIRVFGARFLDSKTICIGHGSEMILTFENVTLPSKNLEVLIRADPHALKKTQLAQASKVKETIIGDGVHYQSSNVIETPTKRKFGQEKEIPMEQRLENLTLSKSEGKVPRVNNVAQLLTQALHSKDKNMLRTALCRKDEEVIRNTVKRLPVTVFEGLITELTAMINGKTVLSHFGALWMKHLVQVHAGILISNPNLPGLFSKPLGAIHKRTETYLSLFKLRTKLQLLLPNVSTDNVENEKDDALVFLDKDSDSESETEELEIEVLDSEAENWEETEDENGMDYEDDDNSDEGSVLLVNDGQSDTD